MISVYFVVCLIGKTNRLEVNYFIYSEIIEGNTLMNYTLSN